MVHYTSCILVRPYSACFYACSPYNCIFTSLLSALKFCYETGNICFLETTFRFEDFKSLFGTNTIESRNNLPNQRQEIIYRNFKTASCLAVAFSAQIHKTLKFLIQNKNELKFKSCVIIQQQFSPNSIQWATLRYSIKDGRCSSDREWSILDTVSICARSSLVQLRHHKFEMR